MHPMSPANRPSNTDVMLEAIKRQKHLSHQLGDVGEICSKAPHFSVIWNFTDENFSAETHNVLTNTFDDFYVAHNLVSSGEVELVGPSSTQRRNLNEKSHESIRLVSFTNLYVVKVTEKGTFEFDYAAFRRHLEDHVKGKYLQTIFMVPPSTKTIIVDWAQVEYIMVDVLDGKIDVRIIHPQQ